MFIRTVVILIACLVCLSSVECQVTEQNDPPDWFYVCSGMPVLTCRFGFVLNIIGIFNGVIADGCSPNTAENAEKVCEQEFSSSVVGFQKRACNNRTWCTIFDYTGYTVCPDKTEMPTNFGAIHYQCLFVGYEGMSSPPTTTTSTTTSTTAATTTVKTTTKRTPVPTTTSKATTTTSPSTSAKPMTTTGQTVKSTTDGGTVTTPTRSSTQTSTTKSVAVGASALEEEEKTKLIVGVSVGAVVLILIIIFLVECKRQTRERKARRVARSAEKADDREMGIQPLTDAERAVMTGGHLVYSEENSIIPVERERKYKKKSETNRAYENTEEFLQPHSEQSMEENNGHLNGHRDSGVSTLFAEDGSNERADDNQDDKTGSDVEPDSPVSSNNDPSQRSRHVSFSDMAINTDMRAINGQFGEHVYDHPTTVPSSQSAGNPALDPSVAGPVSENEVLY
ncbi:uncharacterized protein LOC135480164 [Liolophura sinensis]|uniref:uncharacterized protein LOC135480164 n=1 Tax=Liolophura sinensis TaxID=3198878 RepID=UPI0031582AB1